MREETMKDSVAPTQVSFSLTDCFCTYILHAFTTVLFRTGNMAELIDFSLSVGANAFELYSYEWLVANDKNWNSDPPELNWYKIYGQQYSNALTKASNAYLVPEEDEDSIEEEDNLNDEGDEGLPNGNGRPTSSSTLLPQLVATTVLSSALTVFLCLCL